MKGHIQIMLYTLMSLASWVKYHAENESVGTFTESSLAVYHREMDKGIGSDAGLE